MTCKQVGLDGEGARQDRDLQDFSQVIDEVEGLLYGVQLVEPDGDESVEPMQIRWGS